ncbi:hypothetical protein YC2023_019579 [Brassica napus]
MGKTFLRENLALRAIRHISVLVIRAATQQGYCRLRALELGTSPTALLASNSDQVPDQTQPSVRSNKLAIALGLRPDKESSCVCPSQLVSDLWWSSSDLQNKVRNNAGKTTPTATAPMANTYANAIVPKKNRKNLVATFRQQEVLQNDLAISLGEILGFMKDEQLQKHLPRMFSLIKDESWGLEDNQIPS